MSKVRFLLAPIAAAVLAACAVGPDYHQPDTKVADKFEGAEPTSFSNAPNVADFWQTFDDATLTRLVNESLLANHDLRIALTRIKEARALRGESYLDLAPTITAGGGYTNTRTSSAQALPGVPREGTFYDAGFDAVWELDFFGRVRRGIEASNAELGAANSWKLPTATWSTSAIRSDAPRRCSMPAAARSSTPRVHRRSCRPRSARSDRSKRPWRFRYIASVS